MKLMQKLFHWMMNRSLKFQGCSSIDTGMAKDLDIPLLSVTLGTCYFIPDVYGTKVFKFSNFFTIHV